MDSVRIKAGESYCGEGEGNWYQKEKYNLDFIMFSFWEKCQKKDNRLR